MKFCSANFKVPSLFVAIDECALHSHLRICILAISMATTATTTAATTTSTTIRLTARATIVVFLVSFGGVLLVLCFDKAMAKTDVPPHPGQDDDSKL